MCHVLLECQRKQIGKTLDFRENHSFYVSHTKENNDIRAMVKKGSYMEISIGNIV